MATKELLTKGLKLKIATPNALVDSIEGVDVCVVPSEQGEIGILPEHAPLLATLGTGILRYEKADKVFFFVVSGGVVEVHDNEVSVLADVGESGLSIDVSRARESLERARKRIGGRGESDAGMSVDVARAMLAEKRALARLAVAEAQSGFGAGKVTKAP